MTIAVDQRDPKLRGPLAGVRVIEMGQLLAGPFTASRLADFGAEIIKVETPVTGDPMREWGIIVGKENVYGGRLWPEIKSRSQQTCATNVDKL